MESKNICVLGSCGFIGSNLAHELVKQGHNVTAVDNLFLGKRENLPEGVKFRKDCAGNKLPGKFDVLYHFGNFSSAPMYQEDTLYRVANTIFNFTSILSQCAKNNTKVIYASSSSIQGPDTYYSSVRKCFENLSSAYSNETGIDTIGMRFFSVYGPRERHKGKYANCVTQFLWDVLEGKSPVIYGDGSQTRDFIYVADVVSALVKAMDYDPKGAEVFEVGTGVSYSFNQALEFIIESMGEDAVTIGPTYVKNPIENYVQDTRCKGEGYSKIRAHLDWFPETSFREGIRKIYEYYKGV